MNSSTIKRIIMTFVGIFLLALVFLSLKRPCLELTLFPVLQLESGIFLKLNSVFPI